METSTPLEQLELAHQLELQRQYLDFLANSVEYLIQELSKVTLLPSEAPKSGYTWYETERAIARPLRPELLGEAPIVSRVVPRNYVPQFHPQDKKRNSIG
ncbi:hypothetical protein [Brucella anthropi]|uniref:hypothetical protein n=1 Tax=Brucella anthropi TaxID=529 RepID=UPI00235EC0D0|nr:hypothetical protein [Brucella anthropi]